MLVQLMFVIFVVLCVKTLIDFNLPVAITALILGILLLLVIPDDKKQ